jgi:transposase-like protein
MEGLRTPAELVMRVIILLSYGCPIQAIVHAYEVDERTIAQWQKRAGTHCQHVHYAMVEQGRVDASPVQADEIRVKGCQMIAWMGLALDVSTRLWMAGVVSRERDTALADHLLRQVRACCQGVRAFLICTDGWAAYPQQYQTSVSRKSQEDRRTWKSVFSRVAGALYCDRDQTREETLRRRGHPHNDLGNA